MSVRFPIVRRLQLELPFGWRNRGPVLLWFSIEFIVIAKMQITTFFPPQATMMVIRKLHIESTVTKKKKEKTQE